MANWTKTQLLADLATMYVGIGTPAADTGDPTNGVTKYIVNVVEFGLSEESTKPTAYRKNVTFYVYHEGQGDEKAGYERMEPTNSSNTNVASEAVGSLYAFNKVYSSAELRKRVQGWVVKTSIIIMGELDTVPNHAIRLAWARDAIKDPAKYVSPFMCYIAASTDVQEAGNASADADLAWISYMLLQVAAAYGYTA
jgi:hypothetical protein